MKLRTLIFIGFLLFFCHAGTGLRAHSPHENDSDSIRISLLTCDAGNEIYSLFGHTAIRYENTKLGTDIVFNYGIFSFDTPNFALRFALGETDYRLGATTFEQFLAEYAFLGRGVRQQTLNLSREEKERITRKLEINFLPENRTYRYNYFSDNCSTRPFRLITNTVTSSRQGGGEEQLLFNGDITDKGTGISFRDMLHRYTQNHPWSRLGMDLCIGMDGDREISREEMAFVPFQVEELFAQAAIQSTGGEHRPLVSSTSVLLSFDEFPDTVSRSPSPLTASMLLLLLIVLITVYEVVKGKSVWLTDAMLFLAAGVAGGILAFLACFSQHPMVDKNLMLLVFHPLQLLIIPFVVIRVRKHKVCYYLFINAVLALAVVLVWALHIQGINLAVIPVLAAFIVRATGHAMFVYGNKKQHARILRQHR